ncbi:hypothetical protein VC83_07074 [Pseudogymnoascus destructans]|uniref:Major facilitator superfamily (MFS) profile domain-containing protein n=1 Tax=Pseudogymnoascus destructans TaxID=655981 RepID=A0A177A5G1_9PEZI|nr:uncharacterized protein VC83_07074 [Pseudogymnoascus destructans]OAF56860.1 hypothetical protein VC83_07074 [Pseudogymnoascus destructans]
MHNEADSRALRPQPLVSPHHEPMRVRLNALSAVRRWVMIWKQDRRVFKPDAVSDCGAAVEGSLAKVEQQRKGRKAPTSLISGRRQSVASGTIILQEGILTVIVVFAAYGFIHNYPKTAKFLTEPEREFVQACLTADNDAINHEPFSWPSVLRAVKDPKCWLYGLALSLPLYTLSLFLPTIIKALGYTAVQAQLSVPPYAVATVFTVLVAVASEKAKRRAPVSYVGTIFAAAGIYPATGIVLAWPANNVSGQTKRATANAMQISIGNLGAVLGTQLVFAGEYSGGVIWAMLARENKWKLESERSAVVNESPIENDDDVRKFN